MKSLMMLWRVVAEEFGDMCSVSTTLDFKTVERRVRDEGASFTTITLPRFCDDLQKGLSIGRVTRDMFQGFARHAGLPQFLGGFLELIFDRASGRLIDDPNIEAIQAVRQLTLLFGKVQVAPTERRVRAAMKGFVDCEQEIKGWDAARSPEQYREFERMSSLLWSEVLQRVDNDLFREHEGPRVSDPEWPYVRPKHGPGATADRKSGNRKFDFAEWSQRLESVFPYGEYALPNWRFYDRLDRVDFLEPGTERPVRVIAVPKTLKTPRIIAIEPSYMQFMQQGVKDLLIRSIQKDFLMGRIVGFDDQWRNRQLAESGSLTGSLATLDLSEASDRVSNQLVRTMLRRWPHLFEAVDATRSRRADVQGHGVLRLAKFASMGSALTFPVEAMVFATVVFLGIEKSLARPLLRRDCLSLRKRVRVYGDDIIVPVEFAQSVIASLELFGFKVNSNKSFLDGKFRESCGREYYTGHDISVVRARHVVVSDAGWDLPSSRKFVREIESTVALRNRFYLSGLWRTAAWLDDWIRPALGGWYPTVAATTSDHWDDPTPRSQVLGRWTVMPVLASTVEPQASDPNHHVLLVRGWVIEPKMPVSRASGVGALLKVLGTPRDKPFDDPLHLERAGRPLAVRTKLRWTSPSP
jgi:hypothetical protein